VEVPQPPLYDGGSMLQIVNDGVGSVAHPRGRRTVPPGQFPSQTFPLRAVVSEMSRCSCWRWL